MADSLDAGTRDEEAGSISPARIALPPKVALINSIVARNDAISASAIDTYRALTANDAYRVSLFCYRNDYPEIPSHIVSSVNDLLFHRDYLDADILLWHFGITYDLFNAVMVGNGRARRVVCFHNVTPREFVPQRSWATIDKSLAQCHLLRDAEEVWAVSGVNAEVAREFGVEADRIRDMPLVVESGPLKRPSDKTKDLITILFVGRFVRAKGVLELLQAVEGLLDVGGVPFRLELAGNIDFSDPDYVKQVRAFIEGKGLGEIVTMHGTVDDDTLARLYAEAHILAIPSYHEGFCKPVVEALRAGCIPVGYAAYNLPYVANGFGRLVPPGDVTSLEAALRDLIRALPGALESPHASCLRLDRGTISLTSLARQIQNYTAQFAAARIGLDMRGRLKHITTSDRSMIGSNYR
ncbi:glycosyltransferase [Methylobacterium haplocladii]|uniref:Glycosyl transferase family 1 domain-containing protein n=1 Tax=Methylobacterium haplocladii TaxID=1176176 RepID=A0A512IW23_9HYPH|nr:glycosyltransferase [Methylobacterium haplocladii]GEP01876.1 hypothetical protein MHA02_42630 [Methylobacterium haplocladii]GJD86441.1 D-inositol-3-phosphate glycosyltransferase [Methylobacterium haplocladii]GLS61170.1 hypothetical protein GCM10007887_38670 [Methylobacterium haplocladii]